MKKLQVAVLMGGRSSEREISLASGRHVAQRLDATKYVAIPVEITAEGEWVVWDLGFEAKYPVSLEPTCLRAAGQKVDVAFIALHGKPGEDGTVQGLFETIGLPYTGSGVLASALAMNKLLSKKIFLQENIPTNQFMELDFLEWSDKKNRKSQIVSKVAAELGRPVVVKPVCEGSSIGINIAFADEEIAKALDTAFSYGDGVVVEKYLSAREIQCGIVGNSKPRALPLIEIISKNQFFDYEAKYSPELAEEIVPAHVSDEQTKRVQDISLAAYRAFGCRGFARVDTFLQENGQIFVSEINTIPGLTEASLFPKEAQAAGISFPQLLSILIGLALEKE